MNIVDETNVHQLRNVISEIEEIMYLHLEVEQKEAFDNIVPYNVENIISDNVEECPKEETIVVNTMEKENLYEFGRLCDKTLSDDEESNEGCSEYEFTHGKKIQTSFMFKTNHSNKNRYEVYCKIENCTCRLYAKRIDPPDEFEIRTFNNVHTCSSLQIHPNHKHANKKVMGTILKQIIGKTRSKVWRSIKISRDLNVLLEINVSYKQVWRAKQYTMEMLLGSSEECFSKLPIYFHNLKRHNPCTVAYIQTDSEDCFECCFYVIRSMIRAFKHFCRKVIIMDGAHLKGDFKGTILHAIAMDRNNQISSLTWTWFLEKLYVCVGDCQDLTFVTDRVNAIRVSNENVFPHAHHGVCTFHLLGNIVHRFRKNDKTNVLFWRLVRAYKRNVFEDFLYRFSSTRSQVAAYLRKFLMLNRLEHIPRKRSIVLTEWAEKEVRKNEERMTGWFVSSVLDAIYQVHDFKHGGIVDLRQDRIGLPCGHVIMVLKHLKKTNFGHLAIDAYKMETYRSTYEDVVYSLLELCDWEIPAEMMTEKQNCIPSQGEEPIVRRCSRCDSTTHNATTCPALVPMKQKKATKSSVTSGSNTKGKGKGTQGTHETQKTHRTQETHRTQGT
uniref:MULE transposase domain-containing protein n=1 Tax=Lactuca sativa TaxID=4236 RepID=A0A9R1W0E6_LACSA|nr:hypothetical protein LSAT_V11C300132820 [Lactuca sativa]